MRILLDECGPRRLKRDLAAHDCTTVPEMGWASIKNGRLLALAEARFDVFLTVDRNIQYQQNLRNFDLAVVLMAGSDIEIGALRVLVPRVLEVLETIDPGTLVTGRPETTNQ